ncbi:hypothetical protein FSP39_007973 [Pinctada imbricata]|uniref:Major facilitator superfamily (MFS) profile domain-containing protein n=1 Tax=Pinctada imbricata TaxID=66713 RepID=A0AA88YK18_PINIB|nr:hypothetical protein FSP39_007973 [Pinctada imbricata]
MTTDEKTEKNGEAIVGNGGLADNYVTSEKGETEANVENDCEAPVPPDGGWGWVVTFSSFMISFLVDGVCFTFGIFFPEFLRYFGGSKGKTALLGSVLNGAYLTIGPVVGVLANKYGCRPVAVAGSIVATVGLFSCTFAPNLDVMIFLYGAVGGAGFGLMYLPAIVMVGYYFEKRRAFATGIAVCGSGIGGFVMAPLCEFMLHEYNWVGGLWIISGMVLNGMVFSLFFRPLECKKPRSKMVKKSKEMTSSPAIVVTEDETFKRKFVASDFIMDSQNPIYRCKSVEIDKCCTDHKDESLARLAYSQDISSLLGTRQRKENAHKHVQNKHLLKPLARKDIFYSGSLHNIPQYQESRTEREFIDKMLVSEESSCSKDSEKCSTKSMCAKLMSFFSSSFDFSLLKSPTFLIYGTSCFLCMFGFFIPFNFLPDLAKDLNISSHQGALLISLIGVTNTVTRLLVGYVSDQSWADALIINNIALMIGGAATVGVPFYTGFGLLVVYTVLFGAAIAAFVSLRSIIMVELMGIERLTNAFGLVVLCQGLSSFIGSPIAGKYNGLSSIVKMWVLDIRKPLS